MTQETWRIFTAVPVTHEIKDRIADWCREHRDEILFQKWVYQEDYHITLQFLGDVPASKIETLTEALEQGISGFKPFELALGGIGTFGQQNHPRVLWTGIGGDKAALGSLYQQVVMTLLPHGFQPEERPYNPHITLARKYKGDRAFESRLPQPVFGSFPVDQAVIYRTRMGREPMYEVVGTIRF